MEEIICNLVCINNEESLLDRASRLIARNNEMFEEIITCFVIKVLELIIEIWTVQT